MSKEKFLNEIKLKINDLIGLNTGKIKFVDKTKLIDVIEIGSYIYYFFEYNDTTYQIRTEPGQEKITLKNMSYLTQEVTNIIYDSFGKIDDYEVVNSWKEINWDYNSNVSYRGTQIGGEPYCSEFISKNKYPHIEKDGNFIPLKFLCQIMLPTNKIAFVFVDVAEEYKYDDSGEEIEWWSMDAEGEANAVLIEGETIPYWITMKELETNQYPLYSEKGFITTDKLPESPYWVQDAGTPEEHTKFIFQVDSNIANISTINFNDNGILYVFWDEKILL